MSINPTHNYHNIYAQEILPWKNHELRSDKADIGNDSKEIVSKDTGFWGKDGFSFGDLIDIVNPLQHIPVVSEIYGSISGDTKSVGSDLAGGALFGGAVGFAFSLINSIVKDGTGKTMGAHMLAIFQDEGSDGRKSATDVATSTYRRMQQVGAVDLPFLNDGTDKSKFSYFA